MKANYAGREYQDALTRAISWAAEAFENVCDKQGQPAILHSLRVMLAGTTDDERIVGMLHDVVEDTAVRLDDVYHEFGETVGWAVELLTRNKNSTTYAQYIDRLTPWPLAVAVKIHDLRDNLSRAHELPEPERSSLAGRYTLALQILTATLPARPSVPEPSHVR